MVLSANQIELIAYVDSKVRSILANGGDEIAVLMAIADKMPELHAIITYPGEKELQRYLDKYDGFYHYMKLLESLAMGIQDGSIKVP